MDYLYTIKGSARHATRLIAIQILYQINQSKITQQEALDQFEFWYTHNFLQDQNSKHHYKKVDLTFLKQLINGVLETKHAFKSCLEKYMKAEWNIERLSLVLRCILELALYELLYKITPAPIVINEYVELSKDFFDGEEPAFTNGILDKISKNKENE